MPLNILERLCTPDEPTFAQNVYQMVGDRLEDLADGSVVATAVVLSVQTTLTAQHFVELLIVRPLTEAAMAERLLSALNDRSMTISDAVLLERGTENPFIQTLWNNLPLEKNEVVSPSVVLDAKRSSLAILSLLAKSSPRPSFSTLPNSA